MPSRVASLFVPELPLAAILRAEPELRAQAVALLDEEGISPRVCYASLEAVGVRPGMTAAQARALCQSLILRSSAPGVVRSAREALFDLASGFSPVVESTGDSVQLEVGDMGRLFTSEEALAAALLAATEKLGLSAHVAIAGSSATARVIAQAHAGVQVIAPGEERAALAPLPVVALPLTDVEAATLKRWGIKTLGDLAALPRKALSSRLGGRAVMLHRLASGEDTLPLRVTTAPEVLSEVLELDDPVDNLEPLAFILRGLIDRLVARLTMRSLACQNLVLRLSLVPEGQEERTISVAAPTREVATLLELARVNLAAAPPPAPVRRVAVFTTPETRRSTQLSLLEPTGPSPERLSTMLARLGALCGGSERLGAPALLDSHLPSQGALLPFNPNSSRVSGSGGPARKVHLAPRVFRPPVPIEVKIEDGVPKFVKSALVLGAVMRVGGPYRVRVGFGRPVLRDYFDVEVQGGLFVRLFEDLSSGSWFLEARYD